MLIEFTVKNYRSIKDAQTLSMVKAKGSELEESNTFVPNAPGSVPLLRSAVIYGANAAGKTKVLGAIAAMERIVRTSASGQEGDNVPITPFLLDRTSRNEPTEFEAIFINNGIKYQYGFAAKNTHIVEEWLIAHPKGRPQRWFDRVFNEETEENEYSFGDNFSGQKSVWRKATRKNALFLSTAVQLNSDQLKPVFNWFKEKIRPTHAGDSTFGYTMDLWEADESARREILDFLKVADLDINNIRIDRGKFDIKSLLGDSADAFKEEVIQQLGNIDIPNVEAVHETKDGDLISLNMMIDESDGTENIFSFAGPWIHTLKAGYILVVDELHNSLHPKLVKYLVNLFHNNETNPSNAQLIFTTHETSMLNQDVFRRDQVWFCEKNEEKSTVLYPLTDFRPRKGREDLESSYLSGRYGALPFIDPTSSK
jgi:AAA15 family ATPase/GTPase